MENINNIILADDIEYQQSGIVSKQLMKLENGNITLFAFYKGESLTEHTSSFNAVSYVVEGKMEFTIGGKKFIVESGGLIKLPADVPHALVAKENSKMMLTMIK